MRFSIAIRLTIAIILSILTFTQAASNTSAYGSVTSANDTGGNETLLVQTPFLMAHDAAMAYLPTTSNSCNFYKTQAFTPDSNLTTAVLGNPSAFSSLLDCGVRALDLRIKACIIPSVDGSLCMDHGHTVIHPQTFESELPTIVQWANEYPEELVILKIVPENDGSKPPSTETMDAIFAELAKYNITTINDVASNGTTLDVGCWGSTTEGSWSLSTAREKASYTIGGGQILAVFKYDVGSTGQPTNTSCVNDNYDPKIGYNPRKANESFADLMAYANKTLTKEFYPTGPAAPTAVFQELQMIWQTLGTLPHTILNGYGILAINEESDLNEFVVQNVEKFLNTGNLNLLKMNNVCLHGMDIATALGTTVTQEQRNRCSAACGGINTKINCST
eukprot:CFRG0576T1